MKRTGTLFALLFFCSLATSVRATEKTAAETAEKPSAKKLAVYGSVGDPAPSIFALNGAYTLTPFLRAHGGVGFFHVAMANPLIGFWNLIMAPLVRLITFGLDDGRLPYEHQSYLLTLGGSLRATLPGRELSPMIGLGVSQVHTNRPEHFDGQFFPVPSRKFHHYYGLAGVEYIRPTGLYLGGGLSKSFRFEGVGFFVNFGHYW